MNRDWRKWLLLLSAVVVGLDRFSKIWVGGHIPEGDAITLIPGVFRLTHVLNSGAAFSLFENSPSPGRVRWMLTGFSILAAVVVFAFILKIGRRLTPTTIALALILGGALGNVYDRIRYSMVTDFLEVHIYHYHWPDFNIADSAIVIGGLLMLLDAFRGAPHTSQPD